MKFLLAAAALLAALTHGHEIDKRQAEDRNKKVVCYYTNWSVYRKGLAKYTPQNINPYLCTHLVYAFGGLTDEFEVKPFDSYQDIEQGGYAKFNGLKQYNKALKTLLAIGGWNEGSGRFSELVSLPEFRKTFIISTIKHLRRYNFDGLDLDWEYPASRDGSAPEDRENYAALVRELREAFNDEGSKVKQRRLLLTMAVPAGKVYIDKGYDVPSLTRDLDFFNILNYDYHSAYEPTVNHHASLMPAPGTSEYAWNAELNVDWTVKYYIELGAEPHKLVIGIPTYGRSYTLIDGNFTDFGASADGPGEQGKYTKENGFMAFYEVCENIASHGWGVRKPYPRRIGPYAFSDNQWVGYDDEKIVAKKAEYVREHNLGGIMYWSLDNDDFRGICNGEQYPLVEAGKKALFTDAELDDSVNEARNLQRATSGTRAPTSLSTRLQNRRRPKITTPAPTTTPSPTRPPTTRPPPFRRPVGAKRQPGTRRRGHRRTTTTINPLNTPPPPTTPSPVSSFACKRVGFFPNPDNCHKYYWCLDSGASGLGTVAHAFTCPSDLVFSKSIDGCDHPTRAKCSTEKKGRGGAAATTPGPSTPIPTTTEIPNDYSYYDDLYYYDDQDYYVDEVPVTLAPEPVEEVPNTVSRRRQNSGGSQFSRVSSSTSDFARDSTSSSSSSSSSSGSLGGRSRPQYQPIARDRSPAPVSAAEEAQEAEVAQEAPRRRDPVRGIGGRPQYSAIERPQSSAIERPQSSAIERPQYSAIERPKYSTIERRRPAAQPQPIEEEGLAREAEPTTGGRQYVTIDRRRRPSAASPTNEGATPALEIESPTEPTLQYVTISRARGTTTPATPTPPSPHSSEPSVSPALIVPTAPVSPRYVTIQRGNVETPVEEQVTTIVYEETTVTPAPAEDQTSGPVRIRTHPPSTARPTPPRAFARPRPTRPQQKTSPQPETRQRPTRPLVGISPRPARPFADRPRPTRPLAESPRPTRPLSDGSRPTRPLVQINARPTRPSPQQDDNLPRPTLVVDEDPHPPGPLISTSAPISVPTTLPSAFTKEEAVTVFEEDVFPETTYAPETSVRPTFSSLLSKPAPTTPTPVIISRSSTRKRPTPRLPNPQPGTSPRPPATTTPPPRRSPRPPRPTPDGAPLSPQLSLKSAASSILDRQDYYDYYYEDLDGALTGTLGQLATLTEKAKLMADGSVQCHDTGYFAHPDSCKKFISCSKTVRGLVRGWVYTCPQQLVFDPVGGMCNWAESVDCEGR